MAIIDRDELWKSMGGARTGSRVYKAYAEGSRSGKLLGPALNAPSRMGLVSPQPMATNDFLSVISRKPEQAQAGNFLRVMGAASPYTARNVRESQVAANANLVSGSEQRQRAAVTAQMLRDAARAAAEERMTKGYATRLGLQTAEIVKREQAKQTAMQTREVTVAGVRGKAELDKEQAKIDAKRAEVNALIQSRKDLVGMNRDVQLDVIAQEAMNDKDIEKMKAAYDMQREVFKAGVGEDKQVINSVTGEVQKLSTRPVVPQPPIQGAPMAGQPTTPTEMGEMAQKVIGRIDEFNAFTPEKKKAALNKMSVEDQNAVLRAGLGLGQ